MKYQKKIVFYFYIIFTVFIFSTDVLLAQSKDIVDKIWASAGGKSKWEGTRYIMFTVTGQSSYPSITGDRKFLLDKQSGNIRFEGALEQQNLVVLMNVQDKQIQHVYNESGSELPVEQYKHLAADLTKQYAIDLKLLSLPVTIVNSSLGSETESKIINAEKLQKMEFGNFLGSAGNIYVNQESGLIKQIDLHGTSYLINEYKDIGNGLVFPTRFKSSKDSIHYQKVASFTDMETAKFSKF